MVRVSLTGFIALALEGVNATTSHGSFSTQDGRGERQPPPPTSTRPRLPDSILNPREPPDSLLRRIGLRRLIPGCDRGNFARGGNFSSEC